MLSDEIRGFVEGQLVQAQKRQKDYYDLHSNLKESLRFKAGDRLSIPHAGVANKFYNRWEGGWKVSEIKGPTWSNTVQYSLPGRQCFKRRGNKI